MHSESRAEARRLRILADLTRRLVHPIDLPALRHVAVSAAMEITCAEAGALWVLDRPGRMVLAATVDAPPGYVDRHPCLQADPPEVAFALESAGPTAFGPELSLPFLRDLGGGSTSGSILARVAAEGAVLGLLVLRTPHTLELPEPDFLAIQSVTEILAVSELNGRSYSELERTSRTDPLTGLSTRRHFEEVFRREMSRARRHSRPLSLAMVDIDAMKEINDTAGHLVGDRVIAAVGKTLADIRLSDVAARYGGDEFVILMPDTGQVDAERVCERLRQRLQSLNESGSLPVPVHVSIGIRELGPDDAEGLLAEADAAMYSNKRSARKDRLTLVSELDEEAEVEGEACQG